MSRLKLVKEAEEIDFTIQGTWLFEVNRYGGYDEYVEESFTAQPGEYEEYIDEAVSFAENDFEDVKDIILEQCNDKCKDDEEVRNIWFNLGYDKSYMHIYCNKKFSDETKEKIKEVIIGQYSDGWGEGLEQHPFKSFEDDEGVQNEFCIKLWTPSTDFKII